MTLPRPDQITLLWVTVDLDPPVGARSPDDRERLRALEDDLSREADPQWVVVGREPDQLPRRVATGDRQSRGGRAAALSPAPERVALVEDRDVSPVSRQHDAVVELEQVDVVDLRDGLQRGEGPEVNALAVERREAFASRGDHELTNVSSMFGSLHLDGERDTRGERVALRRTAAEQKQTEQRCAQPGAQEEGASQRRSWHQTAVEGGEGCVVETARAVSMTSLKRTPRGQRFLVLQRATLSH